MIVRDLVVTSLETIRCFDITTGDFMFELDELQDASLSQSQETSDIVGKQGRKISTMKRNKTVTISGTNGIVSAGLLEAQTGSDFESKNAEIMWCEKLTADNIAWEMYTTYKAVGPVGAEIVGLYEFYPEHGIMSRKYTQDSHAVQNGTFTYDPNSRRIHLAPGGSSIDPEGNPEEMTFFVFYKRKIDAAVLDNKSDRYSTKCSMYIDALAEDSCSRVFHIQFFIPKADFSGTFDLNMGDSQTVHNFEAEALAGACGTDGALWTYTVFGADASDAQ